MSTLVLTLDDRLERKLTDLAARNCQPLPDWAVEQLDRLAPPAEAEPAHGYSIEWRAAFGGISDPSFVAPARLLPPSVEILDAE